MKQETTTGIKWNTISQIGGVLTTFVVSTILARLLLPEDFGLIAMILVITSMSEIFIDSGFKSALIQSKQVDDRDFSSVFSFNLCIGGILTLIIFQSAEAISDLYDNHHLRDLTRVISVIYILKSLSLVHEAKLIRALDFKRYAIIQLGALAGAGTIGIALALNDFGVWSLVLQILSKSVITAILLYLAVNWMPTLIFDLASIRKFWKFSSFMLGNRLLQQIVMKLDIFIVARMFQPASLGLYQKAKSLNQMPSTVAGGIVSRTFFPIFSKMQDDQKKVEHLYGRVNELICFTIIPTFALLYLVSEDLIVALFTSKWVEMVPYFKLFCLAGFLWPINAMKINVVNALGFSKYTFGHSVTISCVRLAMLLGVLLHFTTVPIEYLIYVYIVTFYLGFLAACYLMYILLGVGIVKQVVQLVLPLVLSSFVVFLVTFLDWCLPIGSRLGRLLVDIFLFIGVYASMIWLVARSVWLTMVELLAKLVNQ